MKHITGGKTEQLEIAVLLREESFQEDGRHFGQHFGAWHNSILVQ
jgi:hypothetical protein